VSSTTRKPENVHVFLYRKNLDAVYEYAIFQRADNTEWWQGISGGVEDGETTEQAAIREAFEEAGTPLHSPIHRLDTISFLPAAIFSCHVLWGKDVVVVPMFHYAMLFDGNISLSHEHKDVKWLEFEEAEKLVYFHDSKNALWELNQRLLRGNLVRS